LPLAAGQREHPEQWPTVQAPHIRDRSLPPLGKRTRVVHRVWNRPPHGRAPRACEHEGRVPSSLLPSAPPEGPVVRPNPLAWRATGTSMNQPTPRRYKNATRSCQRQTAGSKSMAR